MNHYANLLEKNALISRMSSEPVNLVSAYGIRPVRWKRMCKGSATRIVAKTFNVSYTVSGMTKWLHEHGFRYKKPKATPQKADPEKQEEWVKDYLILVDETPADEPIVFLDRVHTMMVTKVACGWIKKGVDRPIAQTASRIRANVIGAIERTNTTVHSAFVDTVNTLTIAAFFDQFKVAYPSTSSWISPVITAVTHCNSRLQKRIVLQLLPPYSPNLNPIERLWKVMNEHVRNNVFFKSAQEFRNVITHFFHKTITDIKPLLRGRINDNFQVINPASSG